MMFRVTSKRRLFFNFFNFFLKMFLRNILSQFVVAKCFKKSLLFNDSVFNIYIYFFVVVVVVVAIMTSVDYLEKSLDFQTSDLHPLRNRSIMFSIFK